MTATAMASCLRKVGNPQVFRYLSKNAGSLTVARRQTRKIHSTLFILQKYFSEKHEWIDVAEGSTQGTVGITDYAQDKLGEVVYAQLPDVGDTLEAEDEAGALESVKAASDIYSPVSGEVTDVNQTLTDSPKTINDSPFEDGWLFKLTLSSPSELATLMDEAGYNKYLETIE